MTAPDFDRLAADLLLCRRGCRIADAHGGCVSKEYLPRAKLIASVIADIESTAPKP